MAKEDKPLEYERRVLDTKGLAQRVDLGYLQKPFWFRRWRRRLTIAAPLVAAIASIPFILGIGGGKKVFSNGPTSKSHAIYESDCMLCHTRSFSQVADAACKKCHDGPIHQANAIGELRCAECHVEHRGDMLLAEVSDRHCTACHGNLAAHRKGASRIEAVRITTFRPSKHPEFLSAAKKDVRPLTLNHAKHMQLKPGKGRLASMKLLMQCSDCHATDRSSPTGGLLPVTFEQHCRGCHKLELSFDVYQLMGEDAPSSPHTKDPKTIQGFIEKTYLQLAQTRPAAIETLEARDLPPPNNLNVRVAKIVDDSERFLFDRKCVYCHDYQEPRSYPPEVKKVNAIRGQYVEGKPDGGSPWFERARFSHRAHRGIDCSGCHKAARTSQKTTDVLIPKMENCLPCHGSTGTSQDRCAQCHYYHDKSKELDKDRQPVEKLIGQAAASPLAVAQQVAAAFAAAR